MRENRNTLLLALSLSVILLFAGCKTSNESAQKTTPAETSKTEPPAQTAAPEPASPDSAAPATEPLHSAGKREAMPVDTKALLQPKKPNEKAPDAYKVKFDTTRGTFTITVTRAWAPLEADRFYNLVKHHFYDNAAFFRVVPNFVVQFGISPNPAVSAAWKHTEIKDDPPTQSNKRGTITFAQTGQPNSRTTQVFINLKDNAQLDHYGQGFAPFGMVDGTGMNVVDMMYEGYGDNAGPDQDQLEKQGDPYLKKGWPKLDYIKSAALVQ